MADIVPWFANPPDSTHVEAGETLTEIWLLDSETGSEVTLLSWIVDGVSENEHKSLATLATIAKVDLSTAKSLMKLPWITDELTVSSIWVRNNVLKSIAALVQSELDYAQQESLILEDNLRLGRIVAEWPSFAVDLTLGGTQALDNLQIIGRENLMLATVVANFAWFADGMDYADPLKSEEYAIRYLTEIAKDIPGLSKTVSELPWMADDLTKIEADALRFLTELAKTDVDLALQVAGYPWVTDGVTTVEETSALYRLGLLAERDPETAWYVSGFSGGKPVRARDFEIIRNLQLMLELSPDEYQYLIGKDWFTDGLTPEERAFILTLSAPDPRWFYDLVDTRFTQSATISLPLAGEVDLWAFQHKPFLSDENYLKILEEAVRGSENFMAISFPTNDVITLFLEDSKYLMGFPALHANDHLRMTRLDNALVSRWTVYHEVAHYYFSGELGPVWLIEGGADFVASHILDWLGYESLQHQMNTSIETGRQYCVEGGIANIRGLSNQNVDDGHLVQICNYRLGRHFFASLFKSLGEEVVSSVLTELILWQKEDGRNRTEQDIYRTFLKNTPPDLEHEFHDIYRHLHGGAFVDAKD